MIQTIENQRDEIFNPRQVPHSTVIKGSNENTPNIPKKSLPIDSHFSLLQIPSKNDINQLIKNRTNEKPIEDKSSNQNTFINHPNSSQIVIEESNNKKEYTEKKRKRRNKCSYSNSRNKRSKRRSMPPVAHSLDNETPIKNLKFQEMSLNNASIIILDEEKIKENEKNTKKDNIKQIEISHNSKKKSRMELKEHMEKEAKKFMDNLNKEYPDEQFERDLEINLKEKKAQFMKENFPIMFRKDKYYLYTVLLKKRRTQPINFIQPKTLTQDIKESKKHQTLYLNEEPDYSDHPLSDNSEDKIQIISEEKNNSSAQKNQIKNHPKLSIDSVIIPNISINPNKTKKSKKEMDQMKKDLTGPKQPVKEQNKKFGSGLSDTSQSEHDIKNSEINHIIDDIDEPSKDKNGMKFKKTYDLLPKQIWSMPDEKTELNIEMFYDDCIQVWPFEECIFVKEIALEFLMKNKYSTSLCLSRIKDFVSFMKKRAEELDISIINKNEKTVKKYSLRNTKNN